MVYVPVPFKLDHFQPVEPLFFLENSQLFHFHTGRPILITPGFNMDIDQDHKLGNVCQICDVKFASKQNMERHVLEKHGNTDPEKCLQCSKTFTRKDSLELHIKNVHDKSLKSLKCEKCDKTFNKMSNLDRHRRDVHKKEKWFRCPKDTGLLKRTWSRVAVKDWIVFA